MSIRHKLGAYVFLLRRYQHIFGHYWKNRHQVSDDMFKEDEAEFLPSALSLQEKPVSPTLRITAKVLVTLIIILLAWSVFGRIDIIVNAAGEIIPRERNKTIASVDVASVKALYVEEGQAVKKGDVLIELDTSASDAERDKAIVGGTMATLQVARSRALLAAIDNHKAPKLSRIDGVSAEKLKEAQQGLDSQYQDFMAKLQRFDGLIQHYSQALPLAAQQAQDYKELAQNHDVSMHAYLEKEKARVDLEGQLTEAKNQRASLIAETKRTANDALIEADKIIAMSKQDALRADSHSKLLTLTAPVDGTVQQLTVHTVGGVVPAAQPLMVIVPKENHLVVEASLENKDVGFIEEGQEAAIKIDAFEYTKYGVIPGHVIYVSRDAIKDEKRGLLYITRIALDKSTIRVNGHDMDLSTGMAVKVDIKTGTRRVIEYFLSPLLQHQKESLNER